jgi:Ca2+-binding RTX toxin-like protein
VLRGGTGQNLIIAGAGASQLFGGGGDNILIAGTTSYDANLFALDSIMMEWERNIPVADRVQHIRNGGGLNGPFLLNLATVQSNLLGNELTDGGGTNWLFLRVPPDQHHNPKGDDVFTLL